MTFLSQILAQEKVPGPKWVKPSFEVFSKEMKEEFNDLYRRGPDILKSIYESAKIVTFTPSQMKKIDLKTNPGFPVAKKEGPQKLDQKWLIDPKAKPDSNWSRDNAEHRYSSKHHDTVLKSFKNGTDMDMPVLYKWESDYLGAISGRHRITYAFNLRCSIQCMIIDKETLREAFKKPDIYD